MTSKKISDKINFESNGGDQKLNTFPKSDPPAGGEEIKITMKKSRIRLGYHLQAQTQATPPSSQAKLYRSILMVVGIIIAIFLLNRFDQKTDQTGLPENEAVLGAEEIQAPNENYYLYEVRDGDSLFSISEKFQVKWEDIVKLNDLKEPYVLTQQEKLKVPVTAQTKQQQFYDNLKNKIYVVEPGDSFVGIAQKLNISVTDLLRANTGLASPDHIKPGQIMKLP